MTRHPLPPAFTPYMARIGATQIGFRKGIVKQYEGQYYHEVAHFIVRQDLSLFVSDPAFAPTDEEAAAIQIALQTHKFPTSTTVKNIDALLPLLKGNQHWVIWDRATGEIIMVQERRKKKEGGKEFHSWVFTSEGVWEPMEPDGKLPFWKPEYDQGKGIIMIHEGAKAAEAAHLIASDPTSTHPFAEHLRLYEHWGLLGGALAPHRAKWAELEAVAPRELAYASDRDYQGQTALKLVSKLWHKSKLTGIFYGEQFPPGWDIADPIPKELFRNKRYNGPSFESLKRPATWATQEVPHPTKKNKTIFVLRRHFDEEWMHCLKPKVFIHRDWPHEVFDTETFNSKVRPYSDVDDTARLLLAVDANKASKLEYDPGSENGIFPSPEGGSFINTHCPSPILPEKGDATLWEDYITYLFPVEEDRINAIRWIATLVVFPGIRMHYGLLLISEAQGVGKTTLAEKIVTFLLGRLNVSVVNENDLFNSPFNYWLAHKRLAIINEVYQGNSFKAYNSLKTLVTDDFVTVNQKFMPTYTIQNWIHFIACSNSRRALKMEDEDRRWFLPKVTEKPRKGDFWNKFNVWLSEEGGLQIIRWWLEDWLQKNGGPVVSGTIAPPSVLKKEVLRDGLNAVQDAVLTFLDKTREENPKSIVSDKELVAFGRNKFYDGRHNEKLERPLTLRKLAKSNGWFEVGTRAFVKEWGPENMGATLMTPCREIADMTPGEIAAKLNLRPTNPMDQL